MKIIGIVGETASGKSLIAKAFKYKGCKVFDADKVVHKIYNQNPEIIGIVKQNIQNITTNGGSINRTLLLQYLLKNKHFLKKLEDLIHPLLIKELMYFIRYHFRIKTQYIVLDIPLLFQIKANHLCSALIYISTKASIREKRILQRHQGDGQIFLLFPLKTNRELKKYCNFTINSEAEKVNIVYNVTRLLKKISVLPDKKTSVHLLSSVFNLHHVRYF